MRAYLDNSATTPLCPTARRRLLEAADDRWGNPSSLHAIGNAAADSLDEARAVAAGLLRCDKDEIIFTNSGTLSDNAAIFGAVKTLRRRGNRIVTTAVEHPAVENSVKALEADGFEVIRLGVDSFGRINEDELFEAIDSKTVLVSVMYVNNEVGSVMPVGKLRAAVTRAGAPALIHVDAVQAFGKTPIKPSALGIDLLSASAHKIHGPKGAGLLWKRKGVRLAPYVHGGAQEGGVYSGTQPMPAICGFCGAMEELTDISADLDHVTALRDRLTAELGSIPGVVINSGANAFPYIINFSAPGHPSQTVLNYLSERGIYVSAGSACSKGHRSGVLGAMGLDPRLTDSAIRVSLSRTTTTEETDYFLECLRGAVRELYTVGR